ncbi:MAG: TrmH family RNA methyltransferase, partial [Pseudomonadota bacterium]
SRRPRRLTTSQSRRNGMIESPQNPQFKKWRSLLESKGVKRESLAIVSGQKVVDELLKSQPSSIEEMILSSSKHLGYSPPVKASFLEDKLFAELDMFGTKSPLLVMKTPKIEDWRQTSSPKGLQLLLPFGDPANLGAALRNAAAFQVSEVVLLEEACNPFHPKCTRAASGANWLLQISKGPSIKDLRDVDNLVAFDLEGEDLTHFQWPAHPRLLVGDEGPGVPEDLNPTARVKIKMSKEVESLNAVAATAIALFQFESHKKQS